MPTRTIPLILVGTLLAAGAAPAAVPTAELIVTGARIHTVDANRPLAEAMAIADGRVLFVGSERGARAHAGAGTRVVDLGGRAVIPGIIDSHGHLLGLGQSLRTVDLVGTRSYDDVVARVVERAGETPAGGWIQGRGWDQNEWPARQFPHHRALSEAVPDHPVLLRRVDGHALLASARAMELAGVTRETASPAEGRIERDADGEPTGVFVGAAQRLIDRAVPAPSRAEIRQAVLAAIDELHRWGLTGVHDAGVPWRVIEVYEELAGERRFALRNYVMVAADDASLERAFASGPRGGLHDGRLWVRSIKVSADGALGSRGAALLEPYDDDPDNRGYLSVEPEWLERLAVRSLENGFQLNVHAIGDRGNRVVLDAFEAALAEVPVADHRFRIEHAQVIHRHDIPRFAELDVIPSMQGSHQSGDMYWALDRIGWTRAQGAYAWRSLLDSGVVIANGSDFPVEPVDPFVSFHASITRQDGDGWPAGGWFPEQRMSREEALKSMTLWPAHAAFMEDEVGSLSPGKRADFVVLDRDIMAVAPRATLGTRVLMTVLGGEVVYEAGEI